MFRAWHQAAVNCSKDESASGCATHGCASHGCMGCYTWVCGVYEMSASGCATHGCMGVWGVCDECKWVCYTWVCYTWVYGVRQFVNRG